MAFKQAGNTTHTRVVKLDAHNIPTLTEIEQQYTGSSTPLNRRIYSNKGSSNRVTVFRNIAGKKIAIRVALEPTNLPYLDTDEKEEAGVEEKQSLINWVTAAKLGLSPPLLFYGYVTIPAVHTWAGYNGKYLCAVSEGFDMDLLTFYENRTKGNNWAKGATNLLQWDIIIREQLSVLLTKLSQSPLFLICFDIKPMNCVINFGKDADSINVKLIDWDGDWCRKYDMLKKGAGGIAPLAKFTGLMSQIIMANHFWMYPIHFNIFSKFFTKNRDKLEQIKDSLRVLFCNEKSTDYILMAKHYFQLRVDDCQQLFEILFKRCFELNGTSSGAGGKTPRVIGTTLLGGKRKKYKKRRRTKRRRPKKRQPKRRKRRIKTKRKRSSGRK